MFIKIIYFCILFREILIRLKRAFDILKSLYQNFKEWVTCFVAVVIEG